VVFDSTSRRLVVEGDAVAGSSMAKLLKSGLGWIRSDHPVRDFELHFTWQALKKAEYDAGIFFRANHVDGKPFPKGYQSNLQENKEGEIIGIPGTKTSGLIRPGDWNKFTCSSSASALADDHGKGLRCHRPETELGFVGFQLKSPTAGNI
jgi:hypothetical protein